MWRAILREFRGSRGRLVFFTLCLSLGVAAVVGVSSLVSIMRQGLAAESRDLLAADLRVSARRPLPETVTEYFADLEHVRADVVEMGAMASLPEGSRTSSAEGATSRLVEIKAVDGTYPLYGDLVLDPPDVTAEDLAGDSVFIGPELQIELGLSVGDELRIGGVSFDVAAIVVDEPDRLEFAMTLGPRVFMGTEGLEKTSLFGEKSRVRYISLFKLESAPGRQEVEELRADLRRHLDKTPYVRVRTHTNAQPSVRRSLSRVEDYLGLVALLSLLLGGIGVSQIVRAWLAGRSRGVAIMRCLGFRAREVAVVFLGHVALLALVGCVIGALLGAMIPYFVRAYAPELFSDLTTSLWQADAVLRGLFLGIFVAALFSLPPLTSVWRVPPAAVLRAEAVPLETPRAVRYGAPLLLFLGVLVSARLQGGSWIPALAFSGGLVVLAGLLFVGARLVSRSSAKLPRGKFGASFEHGLAALARPGAGTTGAIVALGLGVMVVVSMWLIESRLDNALRTALPTNAPSVFLVDVQPDQWPGVQAEIEESGADAVTAVPVVMARLREIDGVNVREKARKSREGGRATWVFSREQRLTWLEELPPDNVIVSGALWSDPEKPEVSIEQGFAEDLGVDVGSTITLDIYGIPLELHVTSIRTVEWQSFGINFFLVVEPGVLDDAPHFRIAAARLEPAAAEVQLQNSLASSFPNVTMMRIRPILEKVAGVLERIAFGVRALGSFTILTGLVILAGAIGTTALRRGREAALLKTLGVTRFGVTRLFAVEYALSGFVSGLLGACGAMALTWGFLEHLAELPAELPWATIPVAALLTAGLATLSGLAASVRALGARPLETLRG